MIKTLLSRNAAADPDDVLAAKRVLIAAGLYKVPEWGLTSFPDEAMFRGIEALQRRIGQARPDGNVRPDNDTAQAGNGGTIHVNAYEQNRGGHATPVSEHFRGSPGHGNGKRGGGSGNDLPLLSSPVDNPRVRGRDGYGEGHYGANRTDKHNGPLPSHKGVDIVTEPGQVIKSPVTGTMGRPFDPYRTNPDKKNKLSAIRIETDDGHIVEVLYVDTDATGLKKSDHVIAGQSIGTAQDLSTVYPPKKEGSMTNHVDIRIKDKNGIYKDPTPILLDRQQERSIQEP